MLFIANLLSQNTCYHGNYVLLGFCDFPPDCIPVIIASEKVRNSDGGIRRQCKSHDQRRGGQGRNGIENARR